MAEYNKAAMDRLRYLVAQAYDPIYTTRGGIIKNKTKKQRQIEYKVAEEVVRFAFDHAGITGGHLAPGGLFLQLMEESGITNTNTNRSES